MGAKSTYDIPRQVAIEVILANIFRFDDVELEDILERMPQSTFRNYNIVESIDDATNRTINSVEEFEYK